MTDATQEVATKTQESMDVFFSKLTEAATVVTEKLIEVAPDAAEALLNLVQFKGFFSLAVGAALLIGTLVCLNVIRSVKWEETRYSSGSEPATATDWLKFIGGITLGISFLFGAAILLFSFYNWLSAFYPEGAIALKALEAVGINI